MTLPSTIPTPHGEYIWKTNFNWRLNAAGRYVLGDDINGDKEVRHYDWHGEDRRFIRMTDDEVIEFLQAYKEATSE